MSATARLKQLEKASAYQLRIYRIYNEFCRLPEETNGGDALAKYGEADGLAIYKMIVTANILHCGRDVVSAEMAALHFHEYWIEWLMNGVIEEADIAKHVSGCSLMRVSDEDLIAEADKRMKEREAAG